LESRRNGLTGGVTVGVVGALRCYGRCRASRAGVEADCIVVAGFAPRRVVMIGLPKLLRLAAGGLRIIRRTQGIGASVVGAGARSVIRGILRSELRADSAVCDISVRAARSRNFPSAREVVWRRIGRCIALGDIVIQLPWHRMMSALTTPASQSGSLLRLNVGSDSNSNPSIPFLRS